MHKKYVGIGIEQAINRIEDGITRLGGEKKNLRHQSKDPVIVELRTLENIADALDELLSSVDMAKTSAAPRTPAKVEKAEKAEKPKKETPAQAVLRITGVDGFNHPDLLEYKDGSEKITKKILAEAFKSGELETAWANGDLHLAGAEKPATTDEDAGESGDGSDDSQSQPEPSGDAPEKPGDGV